tara:strand:+ start:746 stop:901 length:156 start_codon:yes stop_codon:yes gene_type:complete
MKIEWSEASTKRGIIWVATALDQVRITTVNGTDTFTAGDVVWPVAPTEAWK